MKRLITGLVLVASVSALSAQTKPTDATVKEYLKVSMAQQTFDAQATGYLEQISSGQPAELKAEMSEYVSSLMGWDAYKDTYTELLKTTYTQKELQTAIAFMKTSTGQSLTRKNIKVMGELTVRMAKKQLSFVADKGSRSLPDTMAEDIDSSFKQLKVSDVEEHNQDGKIYFTGSVENEGGINVRSVHVEVNLFDGERFVDQYSTFVSGAIPAGGKRYFKVSCGCKDSPPAKHDAFKVGVVSGY